MFLFGFLIPKVYYLITAYNAQEYTIEKAFNKGDETHYLMIAKNIRAFCVYSDNNSNVASESATWRPPIWPVILGGFYFINENILGLILLKSLLELILILVSLFLIKKYFKFNNYQISPFFLLFIEPQYIKYSITFLSESLTAVFILLFVTCFMLFVNKIKYSFTIIITGLLVVLCHPISVFFVGFLLLFYGLINLKKYTLRIVFHGVLFFMLFSLWPIRNLKTFDKGMFLTASQGAVFSKGWNKDVVRLFNNVDGDLANENLNLEMFPPNQQVLSESTILDKSKLFKESTFKFINSISLKDKLTIMATKIKVNFNPFPMKRKETFIDQLGVFFRLIYLIFFIQTLYLLLVKKRKLLTIERFNCSLVLLAIILGQVFMSAYTYTGLRFNSIYGLTILVMGMLLNIDLLNNKIFLLLNFKKDI